MILLLMYIATNIHVSTLAQEFLEGLSLVSRSQAQPSNFRNDGVQAPPYLRS